MPTCHGPCCVVSAPIGRWKRACHGRTSINHCQGSGGSGDGGDDSQMTLLPTLWRSTATQCSHFCAGSSVSKVGYRILEVMCTVTYFAYQKFVPASFAVLYCASDCSAVTPSMEFVRAIVATAVATTAVGERALAFFIWLAFMAAFAHTVRAALFLEIELRGDCARCCNEAHRCMCGRHKRSIPPGALQHLARVVSRQWRARARKHAGLHATTVYLPSTDTM